MRHRFPGSAAIALLGAPALAAALAAAQGVEPYGCRNGFFPGDLQTITLGRVAGPAAAGLAVFDDGAGCPGQARCRQRAAIPGGTEVLVSKRQAGWACVWWSRPARPEVVGWMRAERVTPAAPPAVRAPLAGDWDSPEHADLHFRRDRAGRLRVQGSAVWHGLGDDVHVGELDGPVTAREPRPHEFRADYRDGPDSADCRAEFLQLGAYLVAHDNGACGGANVRFDDVYRPAARRGRRRR